MSLQKGRVIIDTIYRGYDVKQDSNDTEVVVSKDGAEVHRAPSEMLAYCWIDNKRKEEIRANKQA